MRALFSLKAFYTKGNLIDYILFKTLNNIIMKKVIGNFIDLMKEVYGRTPSKAEIKHLVMTNQIHQTVSVLKQLKAEDEELVKQGVHCHLY